MSSGLFDEIASKGDNISSGLRKVKAEEKTKNFIDKVATVGETKGVSAVTTGGKKPKGPPKFELSQGMGEKWVVENQENNENLEIADTKTKQGVYIFNCSNSNVIVKGKVNNIVIDQCVKTNLILDDAVASVEVVNSQRVQIQVNGYVPTMNVDKTDGISIYLGQRTDINIVYSKSSEMNVLVPDGEESLELPIPEQFQCIFNAQTKKLDTSVVTLNL